jgi:hypothetical protein
MVRFNSIRLLVALSSALSFAGGSGVFRAGAGAGDEDEDALPVDLGLGSRSISCSRAGRFEGDGDCASPLSVSVSDSFEVGFAGARCEREVDAEAVCSFSAVRSCVFRRRDNLPNLRLGGDLELVLTGEVEREGESSQVVFFESGEGETQSLLARRPRRRGCLGWAFGEGFVGEEDGGSGSSLSGLSSSSVSSWELGD